MCHRLKCEKSDFDFMSAMLLNLYKSNVFFYFVLLEKKINVS